MKKGNRSNYFTPCMRNVDLAELAGGGFKAEAFVI